ncbi:hypothetical protein EW142_03190 [Flagellimonas allohymeniacidonis]|uniref:PKD domain-containing protein n=2 Tax=Flagellimonas allohymeniacidonis TaxID=2517819 RepID=A0A4Q8QGG2_9FLAO|nr:hypothetical protein EW142_03190 [Allomuricauda hymeniacidonis]
MLFSCEKEESNDQGSATQLLPIEIVTNTDTSGVGDLTITQANGMVNRQNAIPYNEVQEVEVDLNSEGTYIFEVEDPAFGQIKIYATQEELKNYTIDNPLTLQFEHYKNQKVATFRVQSESDGQNRLRFIDVTVMQGYRSLYHIDWGDGSEEVAEAPSEIQAPSDRIEHRYAAAGEYTITLSTTDVTEVTGLHLQITGNGKGDKIQTLQLEELPNLTFLGVGDNTLPNIDSILERFPKLNHLAVRFGELNSIDVSKNPLLEILVVSDDFDTEIKGLSTLTNLKFLGVTGTIENLNLALHPELYHVTIRGHKMSSLDVSQNQKLTTLILQLNELEQIDLSANVNLENLYITNNSLTQLDLSNNTEIKFLNLYANYIEELDITQQTQLEFLNLSSVHLKQLAAPQSLDDINHIDLTNSRFLNESELLDAVFLGQDNNPKTEGRIIFNDLAVIIDRQIPLLNELVDVYDWNINIPE